MSAASQPKVAMAASPGMRPRHHLPSALRRSDSALTTDEHRWTQILRSGFICDCPCDLQNQLEEADAHGTFITRRFVAFSPREKVSDCEADVRRRMRGKGPWQIQVYRVAAILHLQSSILGVLSVSICVHLWLKALLTDSFRLGSVNPGQPWSTLNWLPSFTPSRPLPTPPAT
jgi:hypothetical protein